jgi:acyl-CoA synthetase (AMP-forming)/AMP-acid ligase II
VEVPLTVTDFLDRAETVFPDREAVVDEPDPPGGGLGRFTYADLGAKARSLAVALDELGLGAGDRVAIMSPNAARFLVALYGVPAFGRVLVPINFRLNRDEVSYIIGHSGSTALLVDPEYADLVADIDVKHRFVLGAGTDAELFGRTGTPKLTSEDELATATINYTSGTTARPKGVQMTHRNLWLNAVAFGWHMGINDRDRYLHTLPMFHCNGWGLPFALTGMGARHVVIRKIDGEDILQRVEREEISFLAGAPAVVAATLDAAAARRDRGADAGRRPG